MDFGGKKTGYKRLNNFPKVNNFREVWFKAYIYNEFKMNDMRKMLLVVGMMVGFVSADAQCWKKIASSSTALHNVAIAANGSLWAWGYNGLGQVGNGTTTNQSSPEQIGIATNWQSIACGGDHSVAIKTNGSLWAWGFNGYGELGNGTTTQQTQFSPRYELLNVVN